MILLLILRERPTRRSLGVRRAQFAFRRGETLQILKTFLLTFEWTLMCVLSTQAAFASDHLALAGLQS